MGAPVDHQFVIHLMQGRIPREFMAGNRFGALTQRFEIQHAKLFGDNVGQIAASTGWIEEWPGHQGVEKIE